MKTTKNVDLENSDTPLLFLDFDGVLNSYEEGSYVTNSKDTYGPSKTICDRISRFCERTGTKIIISSNWRKFDPDGYYIFGGNKVYNPLGKVFDMLGNHVLGTLPPIRHVSKAEVLLIWFAESGFNCEKRKWVIVDDDAREGLGSTTKCNVKDHYVQTDSEFGLTEEKMEEVEKILFGQV